MLVLPLPLFGTVLPVAMLIAYVLSTMKVWCALAPPHRSPCVSLAGAPYVSSPLHYWYVSRSPFGTKEKEHNVVTWHDGEREKENKREAKGVFQQVCYHGDTGLTFYSAIVPRAIPRHPP